MKCLIKSEFSEVKHAAQALHKFGEEHGLPNDLVGQLELMLVEAINNVIEHAYSNQSGHEIELTMDKSDDAIYLAIYDQGIAPPDEIQQAPSDMPDEFSLPEGGWGLGLIHALADEVSYSRVNNKNKLLLIKETLIKS